LRVAEEHARLSFHVTCPILKLDVYSILEVPTNLFQVKASLLMWSSSLFDMRQIRGIYLNLPGLERA
jgi:hypothetical protein